MHKGRSYDESTESYGSTITYTRPCVAELRVSESKEQDTYICTLNNRVRKVLRKNFKKSTEREIKIEPGGTAMLASDSYIF